MNRFVPACAVVACAVVPALAPSISAASTAAAAAPALAAGSPSAPDPAARRQVTALADRYVAAVRSRYPIMYTFSGLPVDRHDGVDINGPAELEQWRALQADFRRELGQIDPKTLGDSVEWVTWQYLAEALRQASATDVCRQELWNVSPLGWQASLPQVGALQPVGSPRARDEALARWGAFGPWIDREIANLREGRRLGYSASQATVQSTLSQLDALLAGRPADSDLMNVAKRDGDPAFAREFGAVVERTLWPALTRYRDYLRDEYVAGARTSPSIAGQPNGRDCYRALVYATTTVDRDPAELYAQARKKVDEERALALSLGRKIYGERATDWASLAALLRVDPRNSFRSRDEVRTFTQATVDRARGAVARMVVDPPGAGVKLDPFPEFQQASAPGGQYIPAADDGSRQATYLFRNVVADLSRLTLEGVIFHETWPGHHLQIAYHAERGRKALHPVSRLLGFSAPTEGWATYAEDFSHEIGLYDSDLDYVGTLMASITPMMVADLGMQIDGWTPERATEYLKEAMPLRPPARAAQSVALIASLPSFVHSYPVGGMEWTRMRQRAERALGPRFDVRRFHSEMLRDGMLPFAALDAKLDRWIAAGGP